MATYEKTDVNVLSIKEMVTTTVTMEELLARKATIENDIQSMASHYTEISQIKAQQLADVCELIAAAENVGVVVTPVEVVEPDSSEEESTEEVPTEEPQV